MKAIIIYCSKTGNTEKVATAIQAGLGGNADVIRHAKVCGPADFPTLRQKLDLIHTGTVAGEHQLATKSEQPLAVTNR